MIIGFVVTQSRLPQPPFFKGFIPHFVDKVLVWDSDWTQKLSEARIFEELKDATFMQKILSERDTPDATMRQIHL